jgi:hypothetical protein
MIPVEKLEHISIENLEALNRAICAERRRRYVMKQRAAAANLRVGQIVTFYDEQHGQVQVEIESFNRKTLSGVQINTATPRRWRVSPSLVKPVPSPAAVVSPPQSPPT